MSNSETTVKKRSLILEALGVRSFRYLWIGQICSQIAANSLTFVLALHLYRITMSNTAVSVMFLVYGLSALALGMVAGTIVDKLENRRVLIICDLSRALLVFLYLFLPKTVISVYILTFINSVITQFYIPAEAPTIPHLVPKNLVVSANSLFSFTYYSSLAIGSVLAGPFLRIFGPIYVFAFLSLLFVLAALSESRLPSFNQLSKDLTNLLSYSVDYILHRLIANISEALGFVKKSAVLTDALILLLGTQVTIAILGTLGPGFADKVMGIDVRDSSLIILGPAVLGIIIGSLVVGNLAHRFKPQKLIQVGIASAGIFLVLIAVIVRLSRIPSFEWILSPQVGIISSSVLFFFLGIANSLLDVPANSILQQESSEEMRGRIYGILSMGFGGIGMLPVVFSGVLADHLGVGKVILALGLAVTAYGIFRMKYNKN
jgi:MFS transporter, DHA3 family, macrolide efflux protein